MSQGNLFARKLETEENTDPWRGLRWFQRECCEAIMGSFEENRSALVVMATGTGKTRTFSAIAREWLRAGRGNVLVLANRDELVQQGAAALEQSCGEVCEIEQAQQLAPRKARLVMASIDTIRQQHRMDRFGRGHFSLIICDEAHHWAGNTYMRPLDFFADAKVLGVTATPDRADEKALGKAFDVVAYCFDIVQGIEQGYLVPLRGHQVQLGEIQLDGLSKVAGDLAKGQLDEVMVRAVEGIVAKTLEIEPRRRGIGFFPGIKSAQYAAERFNHLDPNSTGFVHGGTEENERRRIISDFREGKLRRLMNVGIAIEGFDAPATDLIIQGRPTLSRSFYAQSVGRGGRVLPGVVDHLDGRELAEARRAAIAASPKPDTVILDFVGNATKHALMTPEDLLGGDYSEEEVALAKKKASAAPGAVSTLKALEEARAELRAVAAAVKSRVSAHVSSFNPFAVLDIDLSSTTREEMRWGRKPPTERQLEVLDKIGVPASTLKKLSFREAGKLLTETSARRAKGLATYKQVALIQSKTSIDAKDVSFENASKVLNYMSRQGWKNLDVHEVLRIATGRS